MNKLYGLFFRVQNPEWEDEHCEGYDSENRNIVESNARLLNSIYWGGGCYVVKEVK